MEDQVCEDYSGRPVTIKQCYSAFQILAAGMFLAFLGILFEIFIKPKWSHAFCLMERQGWKKKNVKKKRKNIPKEHSSKQIFASIKGSVDELNIEHKTMHERLKSLDKIIETLQKRRKQLQLKDSIRHHYWPKTYFFNKS